MIDIRDYNLRHHNTFGMDVKCRRYIEFGSADELRRALAALSEEDKPLLVLGGGSNVLFTKDFEGTVLHSAIMGHEAVRNGGEVLLRCGSGETWDDMVALCVANGWHGAENLSLIPGEVGASAVQNIGAYGVEAKDLICKVEAIDVRDGAACEFTNADCGYAYRRSKFKEEWRGRYIITHVTYRLSGTFTPQLDYGNIKEVLQSRQTPMPTAAQMRNAVIEIRRGKLPDPEVEGNAGSFFMNPIVGREKFDELTARFGAVPHYTVDGSYMKIPAGWMIDQCGWKGRTLGRAGVHSRQALVLVNRGGATGNEILRLCETIRNDVKDKFGIEINPEVNII